MANIFDEFHGSIVSRGRLTDLQPLHHSTPNIIKSGQHLSVLVSHNRIFSDLLRHKHSMTAGILVDAAAIDDGRSDALRDGLDMACQLATLGSRSDRATAGMSHHDNQWRMQMLNGILDRLLVSMEAILTLLRFRASLGCRSNTAPPRKAVVLGQGVPCRQHSPFFASICR